MSVENGDLLTEVSNTIESSCEKSEERIEVADLHTISSLGSPWKRDQFVPSVELASYTSYQPNLLKPIVKLHYEGWRRHIESRRKQEEGGRFVFSVGNLNLLTSFLRVMDHFKNAWIEPIQIDPTRPVLVLNFKETVVENDPYYLDNLFDAIRKWGLSHGFSLESMLPDSVIEDLRKVIAHTCVDRFKEKIEASPEGFAKIDDFIPLLRPTFLQGIDSPYYAAALFCLEHNQETAAQKLLGYIHKDHWCDTKARNLNNQIYESRIATLERKLGLLKSSAVENEGEANIVINMDNMNKDLIFSRPPETTSIQQKLSKPERSFFAEPQNRTQKTH